MNFSQLQERVRTELLRRIERGTVSVSLLARQTGLGQPHLSNFLHGRRSLSFAALDKILAAQHLTVADLVPERRVTRDVVFPEKGSDLIDVYLISESAAMHDPYPRASSVRGVLPIPSSFLATLAPEVKSPRQQWERFVAVRLPEADATPMYPLLAAGSILILDRHANLLRPQRTPEASSEQSRSEPPGSGLLRLYAVRDGAEMKVRYVSLLRGRILLRPHARGFPIEIPEPAAGETYHDLIAGRVALILRPA